MAKSRKYYIRKAHRWLGVILGIQFLCWTTGGLYFAWSNMDEVHGDFQKQPAALLSTGISLASPSTVLDTLRALQVMDSIVSLQLINVQGKPVYQVRGISTGQHSNQTHDKEHGIIIQLADAATGRLRGPLSADEAVAMAKARFNGTPDVTKVAYITTVNGHHEYRDNPLPAYAITFNHPSHTTVYVASELGTVQHFRNTKWRIFDFLWMMHTMDYEQRDNISNILLRIFPVFGLVTVISGFVLFFISMKTKRKPQAVSLQQ